MHSDSVGRAYGDEQKIKDWSGAHFTTPLDLPWTVSSALAPPPGWVPCLGVVGVSVDQDNVPLCAQLGEAGKHLQRAGTCLEPAASCTPASSVSPGSQESQATAPCGPTPWLRRTGAVCTQTPSAFILGVSASTTEEKLMCIILECQDFTSNRT